MPGRRHSAVDLLLSVFLWSFLIVTLLGVNYCQKSYDFGAQTQLQGTPSETATATQTVTTSASATSSPTRTASPTGTQTASAEPTDTVGTTAALFRAIKASSAAAAADQLSAAQPLPTPTQTARGPKDPVLDNAGGTSLPKDGNWLGQIGLDKKVGNSK